MNILHIVRTLEPGGLERVVRDLARGLHARGHHCFLACLYEPGSWYMPEEWDGVWAGNDRCGLRRNDGGLARARNPVVARESRESSRIRKSAITRMFSGNTLHQFACEQGIEAIHSHNPEPHRAAAWLARRTRLPLIHTKHGRNYPDRWRRVLLNRWLNRAARSVVAVSENVVQVARDIERVPQHKLHLVRNGVDAARYVPADRDRRSAARQRLGLDADAFVIGSVGRLAPEKHYGLLIRAFAKLAPKRLNMDARLLLVGAGPEEARLKNLASELGVNERVVFAGNQDDLRPYYAAMDVFALSSLTEGMSLTLLEAGASGLACVATDVGGNAEIVEHERTGLIVPSDDEAALTNALDRLCADGDARRNMGAAARQRIAARFSLEAMVTAYETLYEA